MRKHIEANNKTQIELNCTETEWNWTEQMSMWTENAKAEPVMTEHVWQCSSEKNKNQLCFM